MCDGFEREYNDAEEARNNEMALLESLYSLVKEKQGNRKDVTARIEYDNSEVDGE